MKIKFENLRAGKAFNAYDIMPYVKRYTLAIVIYTALSLVLTYPLAADMSVDLPGSGDIPQMVWYFWLTGQMLFGTASGNSLFHTSYIFYPDGIHMVPAGTLYNQVLALILTPLTGSTAVCNVLFLSAFILSGFGAYLLARNITHDDTASIIAGIVYTFAPYHFAHAFAGHMGSVTMQWIPFCMLFIIRTFEKKDIKDAVIAALFFILVAMSDIQYMVFMGMLVILYLLYGLLVKSITLDKKTVKLILAFGIISLIGILPLTFSMISTSLSKDNYLSPDPNEAKGFSNDLLSFIVPSYFHPVFGNLTTSLFYYFLPFGQLTPWECTSYIGISVLILTLYAVLKGKSRESIFWALSGFFFFLMSLGPILHVYGRSTFFGGIEIPMPYSILSIVIPGLSNSRTPGRFDVMVVLSLSILTAMALAMIGKKLESSVINNKNLLKSSIMLGIAGIIIFEYLAVPFAMTAPDVPSFYYGLANETGNFAIMEIPATTNYYAGVDAEYYQTIHQKPMVGGQAARTPQTSKDFEQNTPLVYQLTYLTANNDIFNQNLTDIGGFILNYNNIRYIILHRNYLSDQQQALAETLLNDTLKSGPMYDSDNITVYKVNQTTSKIFMEAGSGWYPAETSGNDTWRWMGNSSTIFVYAPECGDYTIVSNVASYYTPRTLQVQINGKIVQSMTIGTEQEQITVNVHMPAGNNTINLISPDGSLKPSSIQMNDPDQRSLSFAFRNISLTRSELHLENLNNKG